MTTRTVRPDSNAKKLFAELSARGIDVEEYTKIKTIIEFGMPQAPVFFYRRFGTRTIANVLDQVDVWRSFLEKQFLIIGDERNRIASLISSAEWLAWSALIAVNFPQIGPWTVSCVSLPNELEGPPQYIYPSLEVKAVHRDTREERKTVIRGEDFHDPARKPAAWKNAFDELQLADLLNRGSVYKGVASRRPERAWPAFTQQIIPDLYEFMSPYYRKQGRHSAKRDGLRVREALFPKELLEHMLAILRLDHPETFGLATTAQLKAVIQRHLDRQRQSTNFSE